MKVDVPFLLGRVADLEPPSALSMLCRFSGVRIEQLRALLGWHLAFRAYEEMEGLVEDASTESSLVSGLRSIYLDWDPQVEGFSEQEITREAVRWFVRFQEKSPFDVMNDLRVHLNDNQRKHERKIELG